MSRFCLDISSIPFGTGVSRYTSNLVRALIPKLQAEENLILYGNSLRHFHDLSQFSRSLSRPCATSFNRLPPKLSQPLFNSLHFPINLFTGSINLFHAWDWQIPSISGSTKLVSTVHDLAHFRFPQVSHPQALASHRRTLTYLKTHAHHLIAVSQTTKQDLIELFQFDPEKITIIPEALPLELCLNPTADQISTLKQRLSLTRPFFLIVGTKEKRKNIPHQIEAWRHYRRDYDLVIVGKSSNQILSSQDPDPQIHLFSYFSNQDLACLYRAASLLLYASSYEGFGLPLLEAFYHQLPVVTSRRSALPEVAGEAAAYADPDRTETIMAAIGQALNQKDTLVTAGVKRLALYSWDQIAINTLNLYRRLL